MADSTLQTPRSININVPPTPAHGAPSGSAVFGKESSVWLTVFSVFLLVEGCIRFQYGRAWETIWHSWNGSDSDNTPLFPAVLLLLGGLFEVFFATSGLWIGIGHFFLNMSSALATSFLLYQQLLLGTFTYLVWTIAFPAFNDDRLSGLNNITVPFFSHDQAHAARVFGEIITSMSWCGVMQAGQFMFALALYRVQSNTNTDKYNAASYRVRMAVITLLIFAGGLSTFIAGGLFRDHNGEGNYGGAWYYFPNVIAYSELTIISGIVVMVFGLFGLVVIKKPTFSSPYNVFAIVVWVWLLFAHNLAQIAQINAPPYPYMFFWEKTGMTSWMVVLTTSLVLTPMYLVSHLAGNYSAVAAS